MTTPVSELSDRASMSDTGEVDIKPLTPIGPQCHSAIEAFSFQNASFVVKSPGGHISIPRLRLNNDSFGSSFPPQPLSDTDVPGTSDGRTFHTKIRTKDSRERPSSESEVYPRARVNRANANREKEKEQSSSGDPSPSAKSPQKPTRYIQPRGPRGRFTKMRK